MRIDEGDGKRDIAAGAAWRYSAGQSIGQSIGDDGLCAENSIVLGVLWQNAGAIVLGIINILIDG